MISHLLRELIREFRKMADDLTALAAAVNALTAEVAKIPAPVPPPPDQQPAIDALTAQVTQATTDLSTKFPAP